MEKAVLFEQIESLPEALQREVANFVAQLVKKQAKKTESDGPTDEEWSAIERDVEAFERNRNLAVSEEELINSIRNRHAAQPNVSNSL